MFLLGIVALTVSLGLIGWLRSRKLGIASAVTSIIALLFIYYLLKGFIN